MKIEELQAQNLDLREELDRFTKDIESKNATIKNLEAQILKSREDYSSLQSDYNESLKINTRLFSQMNQTAVREEPIVETKVDKTQEESISLDDLF